MSRTALQQLAKLDAAIRLTAREIAEAERGHEATRRELEAARAELTAFQASGRSDEATEDALIAKVARIGSRIDPNAPRGQVDVRARARTDQLRKAEALQRQRRDDWVRDNARAVEAELIAEAKARRDALHDDIRALNSSAIAWTATAQQWRAVAELIGYDRREIPRMPIENGLRMIEMDLTQHHDVPAPRRAVSTDDEITFDARTPAAVAQ